MFPISAHASLLLNVLLCLFWGSFISLLLKTSQQNNGSACHCPTAASPAGGFSPKAPVLLVLL